MGRKKVVKTKDPIRFRFKALKNGNTSIYLITYDPDADVNHCYTYEHLKLFLVPEVDEAAKVQNINTMQAAKAIKAQRMIEYANGQAGIKANGRLAKNLLLTDWMKKYRDEKKKLGQSKSNAVTINNVLLHLIKYKGDKVTMGQVTKAYCEGFILYLANGKTIGTDNPKTGQHHEKPIAKSTARLYFNTFVAALNEAVRDGIIDSNPTSKLKKEEKKPIKTEGASRGYIEIEELKAMITTKCGNPDVKMAFLFACFCGLRLSDIKDLRWKDIKQNKDGFIVSKIQVKTRQKIVVPLSSNALKWMPNRIGAEDNEFVFDLPSHFSINRIVKKWAKDAKVTKNVTFHISRHTFATTLLTLGADIYTTSKLLGHQNIRTTQIYAEVVNQKKVEAVNLVDNIGAPA